MIKILILNLNGELQNLNITQFEGLVWNSDILFYDQRWNMEIRSTFDFYGAQTNIFYFRSNNFVGKNKDTPWYENSAVFSKWFMIYRWYCTCYTLIPVREWSAVVILIQKVKTRKWIPSLGHNNLFSVLLSP